MSRERAASPKPPIRRSRIWATVKAMMRTRISAGLLTVLPIYVTFRLLRFVFRTMQDASEWVVYGILEGEWIRYLPKSWGLVWEGFTDPGRHSRAEEWGIAVLSIVMTVILLYAIGLFTANFLGRRVIHLLERLIARVPLVKTVYTASKQILSSFANEQSVSFQRVVLVPFPTPEIKAVGFLTGFSRDSLTGEAVCSVFIATAPNPTTGFVYVVRQSQVVEVGWTVEEALRMIMSGGILVPQAMPFAPVAPSVAAGSSL